MSDEWGPWIFDLIDCNPIAGSIIWRFRARNLFRTENEWRRWNARYAHTPALESLNGKGYLCGRIKGRAYLAHRVVWASTFGEMPNAEIDHINGDKSDNRISNLRMADRVLNCRNAARRTDNTSGATGVTRSGNAWLARIGTGKDRITLGSFDTLDEAIAARKVAERSLGYSVRHGS